MKTTIGALRGAIKKAIKATETASCSIKAEGESLKVIAASAQGSIMIDVPVEGTASCSATISAKQVGAILGGLMDNLQCTIKPADTGITLIFGGSRIKLHQTFEDGVTDMFAESGKEEKITAFTATGKEFSELLCGPVAYCSKSDIRYYLRGVQAIQDEGLLRLTGTDGVKLCTARSHIKTNPKMKDCIFPRSVAEAISTVFFNSDVIEVKQVGDASNMRFLLSSDTTKWIASAIAGQFPNWRRVMPKAEKFGATTISRDAFASAIYRVVAASDDPLIRVCFDKDGVTVQSTDEEQKEFFPSELSLKEKIVIGATGYFLAGAIEAVETSDFQMFLDGSDLDSKYIIAPVDAKISDWIGVCMPAAIT